MKLLNIIKKGEVTYWRKTKELAEPIGCRGEEILFNKLDPDLRSSTEYRPEQAKQEIEEERKCKTNKNLK